MSKTTDKRIANLYERLPTAKRISMALDAIRQDDMATTKELTRTAPRHTYRQTEAAYVRTLENAESVGLRFDRTFYHALATFFAELYRTGANLSEGLETECAEITMLLIAAGIAAERVGVNRDQFLAFSNAIDHPTFSLFDDLAREVVAEADVEPGEDTDLTAMVGALVEIWEYGKSAGGMAA